MEVGAGNKSKDEEALAVSEYVEGVVLAAAEAASSITPAMANTTPSVFLEKKPLFGTLQKAVRRAMLLRRLQERSIASGMDETEVEVRDGLEKAAASVVVSAGESESTTWARVRGVIKARVRLMSSLEGPRKGKGGGVDPVEIDAILDELAELEDIEDTNVEQIEKIAEVRILEEEMGQKQVDQPGAAPEAGPDHFGEFSQRSAPLAQQHIGANVFRTRLLRALGATAEEVSSGRTDEVKAEQEGARGGEPPDDDDDLPAVLLPPDELRTGNDYLEPGPSSKEPSKLQIVGRLADALNIGSETSLGPPGGGAAAGPRAPGELTTALGAAEQLVERLNHAMEVVSSEQRRLSTDHSGDVVSEDDEKLRLLTGIAIELGVVERRRTETITGGRDPQVLTSSSVPSELEHGYVV